jgi:hypothetical protein
MIWLVRIVAGLVILVGIGVAALGLYMTDERLTRLVMPPLKETFGETVRVGTVGYSLIRTFPDFSLVVNDLEWTDPTGQPVMDLSHLRVTVPVMPLLRGDIRVRRLQADGLDLAYLIAADGTTNLDFLTSSPSDTSTRASASTQLNLDRINIRNARIRYEDRESDMDLLLADVSADAVIRLGERIVSDVDGRIGGLSFSMDGTRYLKALPIRFRQKSTMDLEQSRMTLDEGHVAIRGLALNTSGTVSGFDGDTIAYRIEFASLADNFGALLDLVPDAFKEDLKGVETRGSLTLKGTVEGSTAMDVPDFDIVLAVTDGYVQHPAAPKPIRNIQLDLTATNALVRVGSLTAEAEANRISLTAEIVNPLASDGRFTLNATANADLATVESFYPISKHGLAMRGQMDFKAEAKGRLDQADKADFLAALNLNEGWIRSNEVNQPIEGIQLALTSTQDLLTIATFRARASENTVNVTGTVRQPLAMDRARFDINGQVRLDLATLKDLTPISEDTLSLRGAFSFNGRAVGPASAPETADLTGDLRLQGGSIRYASITSPTSVSGGLNADLTFRGKMSDPDAIRFTGGVVLSSLSVAMDGLDQPVRDMNGELTFNQANVELKRFTFRMGRSDFDLTGSALNYRNLFDEIGAASPMRLTASYASRMLNVDEIWQYERNDDPLYVDLPNMDAQLTARIDSLVFVKIPITQIRGRAVTSPRHVEMSEASARVFDGGLAGYLKWDILKRDHTRMTFRGDVSNVRSEAFFRQFQLGGKSKFHTYVSGGFTAKAEFQAEMNEQLEQDPKTIQANGSFGMDRARIKGHPVQVGIATLLGMSEFGDMSLDAWTATFTIVNGVMTLRDMRLTSKDIGLNLNGTQNMVTDRIDFKVHIALPGRYGDRLERLLTKDGVEALKNDAGMIVVPLAITGSSENPNVGVDRDYLQAAITEYLKKKGADAAGRIMRGIIRN